MRFLPTKKQFLRAYDKFFFAFLLLKKLNKWFRRVLNLRRRLDNDFYCVRLSQLLAFLYARVEVLNLVLSLH